MIIDNLNRYGAVFHPPKTDPELIVYADRMLSASIAFKCFKPIPWRHAQRVKPSAGVYLIELSSGNLPQCSRAFPTGGLRIATIENVPRPRIGERSDHASSITDNVTYNNLLLILTICREVSTVKAASPRHDTCLRNPARPGPCRCRRRLCRPGPGRLRARRCRRRR